ncbi:MAG: CHAT domain-containing protein [Deltaproteobacteria bacterium]|nr:CHAT domain-containing protein [Deltaproteobacteria bacterium]
MAENKITKGQSASSNLEEIFQERERLEQILEQKFRKEVTILFTDICSYTDYIDNRGDINGRALLLKHNRIVLPLVKEHEGKIVEIIGDAVMASFSSPSAAVEASMAIQKCLYEHNVKTEAADRIHVKIGINIGETLVDEAAAYQGFTGDVANVAARIQSQAGPEQILISKAVYEQVCGSEDFFCRFHGTIQAKGKAQPLEVYRVVWQDEDVVLDSEPKLRTHEVAAEKIGKQPLRVFELEIARDGNRLKLSAHEEIPGEESTIRHYDEIPVSMEMIQRKCHEMVETLNKANRKGRVSREAMLKLREIGQVLHDELFSLSVKEKLRKTKAEFLSLKIDDQLVHVPWELLSDGRQFLCQRFNMGRLVKTRQPILGVRSRVLGRPLRMLILADPEGDLKGAYAEGIQIRDYVDRNKDLINAFLRSGNTTPDSMKEKIRNFDFVHFAGHADYNPQNTAASGWRLTGGNLTAQDITKMAGTATMPALIFSNACQSARTEEWTLKVYFEDEIFGLANAFLLAGVKHYLGTFWEISDEPSSRFAIEFYENLLSGMTIGEATRRSRQALIKEYGEETIVWASYVLYGDPTSNYKDQIEASEARKESEPARISSSDGGVRTREEVIDFADTEAPKRSRIWWSVAASIVFLVAVMLWGYPGFLREGTIKYERAALAYYDEGNFKEALNACNLLEEKNAEISLSYLIRGNIFLAKGELDVAEAAYQKAIQGTKGTDVQKAHALVGLGRLASLRKQPDDALRYYQQATEIAPQSRPGYLSQALLLEDRGDYDKALDLFGKAQALAPQDQTLRAITNETRKKAILAKDQKKQERIDRIVKELLEGMKSPSRILPSDGWTSPPLTMWVMDLKVQGYSLQEGQERLLVSGITDQMLQRGRARLVERALLDKLVEELKLGTSKLIDRRSALSLGKVLAARLILSGQMVYSGPQVQVSMRLIETETGQIAAAVNESFGSAVPASVLAERLSKNLLEKLEQLYPLRGKVSEVKGEEISLNIGQMVGVKSGQRFRAVDEDVTLEVTSIQQDTSLAKIVKGKDRLQKSLRVEAI